MIKSVEVTNPKGESLILELSDPWETGLAVLSIEGLGPPKAEINSSSVATTDGAIFNSARVVPRNIVITLAMLSVPDVETTRQKTYKYFPIKQQVELVFHLDNLTVRTSGYVESNEPTIFSDKEQTSISIICMDPYMYDPGKTITGFSVVRPSFEFPFSNESVSEDLLEMSSIQLRDSANIFYDGNVPTGMVVKIRPTKNINDMSIVNVDTNESMTINSSKIGKITGKAFGEGDELVISTYRGRRSALLYRGGKYYNVINCIGKKSKWFQITPGPNRYAYDVSPESDKLHVTISFEYQKAYGGV